MKKLALPLLALTVALAITGCAVLDRMYGKTVTAHPQTTNVVTRLETNTVVNWVTNSITDPAGNVMQHVSATTNVVVTPRTVITVTPAWFETNLVANTSVEGGISAVGGVAGSLGVPGAGLIGIVLGWLYPAYAAFRNKKANIALVTGIEAGRQILQETPEGQKLDARMKDALINHQEVAGVLNLVSGLVNRYTGDTVKSTPPGPTSA